MRGKGAGDATIFQRCRITPAYAGKSALNWAQMSTDEDHPRLCGEKVKICLFGNNSPGSPPPMRGKACGVLSKRAMKRITPAYAGKRAGHSKVLSTERDHPRLCGEKFLDLLSVVFQLGSPPPMRGKVITRDDEGTVMRITPAYAGKRLS